VLTKSESLRLTRSFIPHDLAHIPIQDDGREKNNLTHLLIQDDGRGKTVMHNDVGSSLSFSVILSQGAHPFLSPSF
jgi:hypothetical protein